MTATTDAWSSGFILSTVALVVFTGAAFASWLPWIKRRP